MANQDNMLLLNPRPESYLSLLGEKTLAKIFDHLNLYELLQVGELDMNYQRIIGEHIISKGRTLDVSAVSAHFYTRHTMKQLGEFATSIIIKESDIQYKDEQYSFIGEIFRIIEKRCSVGRLKSIKIILDKDPKESRKITMVPKCFMHIESLTVIIPRTYVSDYNQLMTKMIAQSPKLKSLELYGHQYGLQSWLLLQLKSLEALCLRRTYISNYEWLSFAQSGLPQLKSLAITEGTYIGGNTLQQVAHAFPNLEKFEIDEPNLSWCHLYGPYFFHWTQLDEFQKLKEFKSKCINIADIISALAKQNRIEKLSTFFGSTDMVKKVQPNIHKLTNLQSIELLIEHGISDQHIEMSMEILMLPKVTECTLIRSHRVIDQKLITAVACASENLRILRIHAHKGKLQTIASCFYNSLVKARSMKLPTAQPLHMYGHFHKLKQHRPDIIMAHHLLD